MALRHYDGINPATGNPYPNNVGTFNYDDTQFTVAGDGRLYYIGSEVMGENIEIPAGIRDCTGMFSETYIVTPPIIPNGVKIADEMFRGCKSLTKYPELPSDIQSKKDYLSDIFKNDLEYDDRTMQFISREMDEHINSINNFYDKEILHIENFYSFTGNPEKMNKALINADLISRMAICHKQIQGLTKMQNHLNAKAEYAKSIGAPKDYMKGSINFKQDQINQLKTELNDIKKELRYRNPTVFDIAKAAAIDAKEKLVSYSQKVQENLIDKATSAANAIKRGVGNVYRASELAATKVDLKILEGIQNINRSSINLSQKIYSKIMPGISAVSEKASAFTESLKTLKANLKGQTYTAIPGMTQTGVKLIESMKNSLENKIDHYNSNENKLGQLRDKVRDLSQNLSPKERSDSQDFLQNISQKMNQITANIRSAAQERISSYQAVKDQTERGNISDFEQVSNEKELSTRFPNGVRSAEDMFPSSQSIEMSDRKLFNEITPVNEKPYTSEEMNAKFDQVLNNIKNDGQDRIDESIKRADEKGTFEKPDHAETLHSTYSDFFGGAYLEVKDAAYSEPDNDIMASISGLNAVNSSQEFNSSRDWQDVPETEQETRI